MSSRVNKFLPGFKELGARQFGGALLKGNPREARPISTKRPMHLVLRSSMAKGKKSFLHPERVRRIEKMVHRLGKLQGVKIFRFVNSGDHLHLLVLPRSRKSFHTFVRSISGVAARLSTGKERGKALDKSVEKRSRENSRRDPHKHFWDARPFSRVLEWGKEYLSVHRALKSGEDFVVKYWPTSIPQESSA